MSVVITIHIKQVNLTNKGMWSYRNSRYTDERNNKRGFDKDYFPLVALLILFGFITLPLLVGWLVVNKVSDFLLGKFIQKDVNDSNTTK
jgi:hypothetical protein